ncbi:hypothetical protein GCM10027046_26860 [Uliginosibacterium flavum]
MIVEESGAGEGGSVEPLWVGMCGVFACEDPPEAALQEGWFNPNFSDFPD